MQWTPGLPLACVPVLGVLRRIQNRLNESRIELEIAVALDRNNAHALFMLGQTLMFLGQPEAAIPLMESANRLDPRDPNSAFADWALAACDLLLGRVAAASDRLRKARDKDPRIYFFQLYLAAALGLNGDLEEAKQALAAAFKLKPEVRSLAQWRATQPWITNPQHWALFERTVIVGLRRAGMPDQ
jgi:tetratricopeptide (TPR) repeat protein